MSYLKESILAHQLGKLIEPNTQNNSRFQEPISGRILTGSLPKSRREAWGLTSVPVSCSIFSILGEWGEEKVDKQEKWLVQMVHLFHTIYTTLT